MNTHECMSVCGVEYMYKTIHVFKGGASLKCETLRFLSQAHDHETFTKTFAFYCKLKVRNFFIALQRYLSHDLA